ncbi:reverse transcriptase domain-containing protein [Tanacetum coccineum]
MDRWTLFTNGASNSKGSGVGLVLISPSGLRMARKMKVQDIDVKVDSKLVASQINGSYVASSTSMIKYLSTTKECIAEFKTFAIQNIPRNLNQKAGILRGECDHIGRRGQLDDAYHTLSGRGSVAEIQRQKKECTSERGTCSGIETPQNIDDLNHGPVDILLMGNGHPWSLTPILRKVKVRYRSHQLLHKMDQSKTVGLDYRERPVIPADIGMPTHRTMMIREDENEDEFRLNMDLLQERREAAAIREAKYKTKME